MKKRNFTEDEIIYIQTNYPFIPTADIATALNRPLCSIYGKANKLGLRKDETYFENYPAGRLDGIKGAESRFKKGHIPFYKGKKLPPDVKAKLAHTWFPKGNIPHNTLTNGAMTKRKMGYWWTRIKKNKWELSHRVLWIEHYGAIPENKLVAFKDGNQDNLCIENLYLTDRTELMDSNTIHNYPPEVKTVIRTLSKLNKAISNYEK